MQSRQSAICADKWADDWDKMDQEDDSQVAALFGAQSHPNLSRKWNAQPVPAASFYPSPTNTINSL